MVVSVLGSPDDDDHGGAGPVPAAQVVRGRDQLIGDRAVAALEVPVLRGAPQVGGLQVGVDFVGQTTTC